MSLMETLREIYNQLATLPDNMSFGVEYIFTKILLAGIELKLYFLETSWSIASGIISTLGYNGFVSNLIGNLPPEIQSGMQFFKVFEVIEITLTAYTTRFVLRKLF